MARPHSKPVAFAPPGLTIEMPTYLFRQFMNIQRDFLHQKQVWTIFMDKVRDIGRRRAAAIIEVPA